jgi:hypothetical protein
MKGGENDVSFFFLLFLPKPIKHGTFQRPPSLEPSKSHQAWNLPLATMLGFSFTSFLPLLFKGTNLDHLFLYF